MTDQRPVAGRSIRQALDAFVRPPLREMLIQFWAMEAHPDENDLATMRQVLWSNIVSQALADELTITGFRRFENAQAEAIDKGLLQTSKPDLNTGSLSTDVGVFTGILIHIGVAAPEMVRIDIDPTR